MKEILEALKFREKKLEIQKSELGKDNNFCKEFIDLINH